MRAESYVLGFDARRLWEDRVSTPKQKEAFLFRLDVERVLSVDVAIWPSVFPFDSGTRPQYVGFFQDLWEELDCLREHIENAKQIRTSPADLIAVTLHAELFNAEDAARWEKRLKGESPNPDVNEADLELPYADPPRIREDWSFMGYDVCDEWGISGLSNCGFKPGREDVQALRGKWGPRVNRFHLFDAIDHAVEFKGLSDQRCNEHAPFFVYGLWLVQELKE
jgi:hypothetical protein